MKKATVIIESGRDIEPLLERVGEHDYVCRLCRSSDVHAEQHPSMYAGTDDSEVCNSCDAVSTIDPFSGVMTIKRPVRRIPGVALDWQIYASSTWGDQVSVFHAPDGSSYVVWTFGTLRSPKLERYPDRAAAVTAYAFTVDWWGKQGILAVESGSSEGRRP